MAEVIDVEVVREEPRERGSDSRRGGGPPIHVLSALLLIAVDNLWNLAEFAVVDWVITVPLCFLTVATPTFLIQKLIRGDSWGRAVGFALLLGVVAAIPTSVTGTPVGLALLAWTGLSRLVGQNPGGTPR